MLNDSKGMQSGKFRMQVLYKTNLVSSSTIKKYKKNKRQNGNIQRKRLRIYLNQMQWEDLS